MNAAGGPATPERFRERAEHLIQKALANGSPAAVADVEVQATGFAIPSVYKRKCLFVDNVPFRRSTIFATITKKPSVSRP